jgi:lysyl-tRNA synthetase class 2
VAGDELYAERLRKVEELRERGIAPYGVDFQPTATMQAARELLERWEAESGSGAGPGPEVAVAGRVMQLRDLGGMVFAHLQDESEPRMQMWFRADQTGEDGFRLAQSLDLGDIVGVRGKVTRTRRGEPSVLAGGVTLLVKALRPPPEKWHGLQDQETRYRKRYLDLLSSASQRRHFAARTEIVRSLRSTLDARGFLEVETPILVPIPGGGAAVPFVTHWNALHTDVYLRIAIELHLKRLLVGGYHRVYELGRVFRNEGLGPRWNPEFTMLEVYQAYADYTGMRELTEVLISNAAKAVSERRTADPEDQAAVDPLHPRVGEREIDLTPPYRVARMVDLVNDICGVDVVQSWDKLGGIAEQLGVDVKGGLGPGAILLEIYEQRVEPELWEPTFVTDYPAEVSPLARRRQDDPRFVERFELIAAGRELANAFSELNDPIDQRARMEEQARLRAAGDAEAQPIDEDFLEALEMGMPPAGGLGLGVDRLVMLLTGALTIRDVLLFPTMRPQSRRESANS